MLIGPICVAGLGRSLGGVVIGDEAPPAPVARGIPSLGVPVGQPQCLRALMQLLALARSEKPKPLVVGKT